MKRQINPISFLWIDAYSRICSLATNWCANGMPSSALDDLYQFSESEIVTNLQLETDEQQEAIFHQRFETDFHRLIHRYAEEFAQIEQRFTDTQMDNFLSGRPMPERFAEVEQQIRTQRAKIQERMERIENQLKSVSREEREGLCREFLYLAHQSGTWSEELLRRLEERL
ncbi:MAG: hypothetical protein EOP06_23460 [Proteobacteria bacterium]|nr:MAG: hypothetical protein EOP06_23460 [Pseudomonadota bacterium]